jgi:chromosome segregation ATPase
METGEDHQWFERSTGQLHSMVWYSREYALWLEEKLLEKLQVEDHIKEINDLLEFADQELQDANREIANFEEKEATLEDQMEYFAALGRVDGYK